MGRQRANGACSTCRRMKRRCDGGKPCNSCKKRNLQCDYLVGRSTELVQTDRRTSADTANSYTYFYYIIRQRNSRQEGFGYVLGDGNLIVETFQLLPVLRKAMSNIGKGQQTIRHGDLTIEILLGEPKQSAKLSVLHDGEVCITAEFFVEAPGQQVRVSLWKVADGTTRNLGPATGIGPTQWYIVTNYDNLIGHAVIFTRRQEEVVISVPVPPSSQSPFHESTSFSVPVGSTVSSPQAERQPTCAWVYKYGVGRSSLEGMLIKLNSVYYTGKTNYHLRTRLIASVEKQSEEEEARHYTALSIKPRRIHYCTEKYVRNQLHLQANFSQDVSDRSISIEVYTPGERGGGYIDAQQHKEASQCRISIDSQDYQRKIIVFNCDDEYIVSCPVKRRWTLECESLLYKMKGQKREDSYIYNFFSSYITSCIAEDLAWFSQPLKTEKCHRQKRKSMVSEWIANRKEFRWRKDRQKLGDEFRGLQFLAFTSLWRTECSAQRHHPTLSYN